MRAVAQLSRAAPHAPCLVKRPLYRAKRSRYRATPARHNTTREPSIRKRAIYRPERITNIVTRMAHTAGRKMNTAPKCHKLMPPRLCCPNRPVPHLNPLPSRSAAPPIFPAKTFFFHPSPCVFQPSSRLAALGHPHALVPCAAGCMAGSPQEPEEHHGHQRWR